MNEKVYQKLSDILKMPVTDANHADRLDQLSAWDSITLLEYIAFVDREFKIAITQQDIEQCKTIGDLVKLAEKS